MTGTDADDHLAVALTGWPAGVRVSVTVCGAGAAGSAACAVGAGTLLVTSSAGTASGSLGWAAPPAPCPCVLRAVQVPGGTTATGPAPARVVGVAPSSSAAVRAGPDSATVYAPVADPPLLTPALYLSAVGVLAVALLALAWRTRWWRGPGREVWLLRAPAAVSAAAAVAVLAGLGYRSVEATSRAAVAQRDLTSSLASTLATPGEVVQHPLQQEAAVAEGEPFALLRVPRFGAGYQVALVEGVSQADLAKGPGHYPGTAAPGQVGNFAVAGHRGPPGEPFNDVDLLVPGDRLTVETPAATYTYEVTGHAVVAPDRVDVVAPVPEHPGERPTAAVLTLTACHPKWSSAQRWVVWASLVRAAPKS